jgi:hypothetical protein
VLAKFTMQLISRKDPALDPLSLASWRACMCRRPMMAEDTRPGHHTVAIRLLCHPFWILSCLWKPTPPFGIESLCVDFLVKIPYRDDPDPKYQTPPHPHLPTLLAQSYAQDTQLPERFQPAQKDVPHSYTDQWCRPMKAARSLINSVCSERNESSRYRHLITNSDNSLYAYTPSMCLRSKLSESVQGYI